MLLPGILLAHLSSSRRFITRPLHARSKYREANLFYVPALAYFATGNLGDPSWHALKVWKGAQQSCVNAFTLQASPRK